MNSLLTERAALFRGSCQLDPVGIMAKIIGRRNIDVGGPDYMTDLSPLLDCNTNSYRDISRIVRHMHNHYGLIPLILRITGDGQTIQFLGYLKRRYPDLFKHVLISNGNWHSNGHFMLQGYAAYFQIA